MTSALLRRRLGVLLVATFVFGLPVAVFSQDLRIRVAPQFVAPLADRDIYGNGVGARLGMDTDAFGFVTPYGALGARYLFPRDHRVDSTLFLATGGVGAGVFVFPLPRLKLGLSGGGGVYVGSYRQTDTSTMTGNLFWEIGGEAGFRVTPSITVSGSVSYLDLRTQTASFFQGLSISLIADLGVGTGAAEGRARVDGVESTPVLPIIAPEYASTPFGNLTIRNAESAEMRDVRVWFQVEGYTSGPVLCGTIPYLAKRDSATVPLVAGFSEEVMDITENVRVSGEVRIVYDLLGEERDASSETTVTILHRNSLQWRDKEILAAFVSPNDPAVLEVSKYMAGVVRAKSRHELDANLQYALGLFEGLRLLGLAWAPDPQTPYSDMRGSTTEVDYVQYPYQTLAYRSGDSDDLAVAYAAALESVGVPAALIPSEEEVVVAFRMERGTAATEDMFLNREDFIFDEQDAWVPVRVSMLREGFLQAWAGAGQMLQTNPAFAEEMYPVSEAWAAFPPAGVPDATAGTEKPGQEQLETAFENVVDLVVAREVTPRVERLRASFGPDGGNGRQRNFVGVTYARYGMYEEALAEFEEALELGYSRAAVNTGNIAFLLRDYETAVEWYQEAVNRSGRDSLAVIGLARALYELDRFEEADEYFGMATEIQPELRDRYSYLSARLSGSEARASAAADRAGDMLWNE